MSSGYFWNPGTYIRICGSNVIGRSDLKWCPMSFFAYMYTSSIRNKAGRGEGDGEGSPHN
jgi:hypothetical protein